jgi:hypothetical protein
MRDEFSVYWWDRQGMGHTELCFVSVERAWKAVQRLTKGPAAHAGIVKRVIITDGGDCCAFEWKDGRVTFLDKELHDSVG